MARIYGRKILNRSGKLVDFIKTNDLEEAKRLGMAVDMNLDHRNFYSEAGYLMEKTYKKFMESRPSLIEALL